MCPPAGRLLRSPVLQASLFLGPQDAPGASVFRLRHSAGVTKRVTALLSI